MKRNYRKNELKAYVMNIHTSLCEKINNSNLYSKYISDIKVIPVNIFGYTELGIVNDNLTFLDEKGYHYSINNGDCTLEDLIDILND